MRLKSRSAPDGSRVLLGAAIAALVFGASVHAQQIQAERTPLLAVQEVSDGAAELAVNRAGSSLAVTPRTMAPDAQGRYLSILRFVDKPLARYDGGVFGYAATSVRATGAARLDTRSPAYQAYRGYLEQRQSQHLAQIGQLLGRSVGPEFQYLAALNGAAMRLTLDEAQRVSALDFVIAAHLDEERQIETDVGPGHIGAPSVWGGDTTGSVATRGEGVIVGIIDSGINFSHPSFAETDGDGYTHTNPYGAGVYRGWCDTNPGFCNEKLIAARVFNGTTPADTSGHGSHVASTAAGNVHTANFDIGGDPFSLEISGVAPRANVVAYKVCDPGCPGAASIAAVDAAIDLDEVDVINYSISGSDFPWDDPVNLAFLDAFNAGIYVSTSAGNDGLGASTVAKTGPWNAAVAASTHRRAFGNSLDVTAPTTPAALQGVMAVPGENTEILANIDGELRFNPTNAQGCNPGHPEDFFLGSMALVVRGGCMFVEKVNNAVAAGATGLVVFNHVGGPPTVMGGGLTGVQPAVMIGNSNGIALRDYVIANPGAEIRINTGTVLVENTAWQDVVGGFSSRGPSQYDLLAPTFIAPGVSILAAGDGPGEYFITQGTSMSSPHGAGAAALVRALNPTWSPAEMRSALALSAVSDTLRKEDGITPADPFDRGSGLLNLQRAGNIGLVMDETGADFAAADPGIGGDPRTLNVPSLVDQNCIGGCSFTRTVTSVLADSQDYSVETTAPTGITVTVTPNAFTLAAGLDQELTIDVVVDENTADLGNWNFGDVSIVPQPGAITVQLDEDFSEATFPPTGWSVVRLAGVATVNWRRVTTTFNSTPASAHRRYSIAGDGFQDEWLISPAIVLPVGESGALDFADQGDFMSFYGYAGAMISIGSCDPADGEFVQLREIDDSVDGVWRDVPSIDLSVYAGETVCVAFRYSGTEPHSWWVDDVVVTSFSSLPLPPTVRMPLAIVPLSVVPEIDVTPDSISASGELNGAPVEVSLRIDNLGAVDLTWSIDHSSPLHVPVWHQGVNGTGGIVSDFFIGSNAGAYSAADFELTRQTTLSRIFTPGYDDTNSLAAQPAITWQIYADASGVPAGHPEDGTSGASALWTYTAAPAGPGVYITDNDIALDLVAAGEPLQLAPGTYWLTVFPSYNVTGAGGARWNWYQAAHVGAETHLISPGIFSISNWTPLTGLSGPFTDTALTLSEGAECGAPWMTVDPVNGLIPPADFENVTLTLDPDGLAAGTYNAYLCFASDDTNNPLAAVRVDFEVVAIPEIALSVPSLDASAVRGGLTEASFNISNVRDGQLDWTVDTAGSVLRAPEGAVAQVIYDNGPFVTSIGDGPAGSEVSLLQNASLGMNTLGSAGWQAWTDTGTGTPAQGAPFVISGFDDWCQLPSAVTWLSVDPPAGSTAPGDSDTVTVTMDADGLAMGNYEAKVCVFSNDPITPLVSLPVSFEVTEPDIELSPLALAAGQVAEAYSAVFTASGDGTTAPFTIEVTAGVLPDGLDLAADGTLSGTPTEAGEFNFTVTATDATAEGDGGPFSGSRSYSLRVEEEFIFFDSFESIDPLPQLNLDGAGSKRFAMPVLDRLAQHESERPLVLAEVLRDGDRIGLVVGRCDSVGCELKVVGFGPQGFNAGWQPLSGDPATLELVLDGQGRVSGKLIR